MEVVVFIRNATLALAVLTGTVARAQTAPAKVRALDPANFDTSVKPCEDFYAYANGNWLKSYLIPADRARYGSFDEVADRNREVLRKILEETSAKNDWPKGSNEQKVGDFYAAGMDEAAIERAGTKPLAPLFAAIDKLKAPGDLPAVLAELHARGLEAGFNFRVAQDARESTRYIGILNQGGLGLPDRDYYTKDDPKSKDLREAYRTHVARMFELSGDSPEKAKASADIVMTLETRLAEPSLTRVENRDPQKTYNKRTLAALASEAPGFDFPRFFSDLGASSATEVNVRQPRFFVAFGELASTVPAETWRTYLKWHVLRQSAPHLSKVFEDEAFAFSGKTLMGVPEQEPRWRRVQAATDQALGEALGPLYVARAFTPRAKERMRVLVENLRAALKERIDALPWMSAETKKQAQRKLTAFNVKIGYPDKWRDYSTLAISRGSYLENVRSARTFETKRNVAKLGKPIDRTEWGMTPPTVNAYYNASMNEIVFPAGILQPPFFSEDADDAVNYGGIGVVIGHEMSHGFDDSGSQYDADGNLKNWWTAEDRKAYEARTGLIVKQFEGYKPLPDQAINGKLTLGENIGDLGGIKIAYAALQRALAGKPTTEKIEGFTPEQRFFLSYATIWRTQFRDEALRVQLNTNPHSPGKWRAIGPTSNLPEFYDAFGCAEGAPMRRAEADRPSIW